jgi:polysaccharide export outer membrane protein
MKIAFGVLITAATLSLSADLFADTAPEWLRNIDRDEESRNATAVPEKEPILEEYVVTAHGVETVEQRNARLADEAARAGAAATEAAPPVDRLYGVQPGDVLQITVWREPELGREVAVSPDGRINYPLIGSLRVEDKSVDAIGAEIEAGLSKYMKHAPVTVTVKELQGNRIYVIGQVNRPGVFPFTESLDVMQALSLAGGAGKFADLDDIKILRRVEGVQRAFTFNYSKVQSGRDLEQNILLESGDVIMVP